MAIVLGTGSLGKLEGVDPRMVRVVKRAAAIAEPADDFMVLEGVRSEEQCRINYGKGRTGAQLQAKGIAAKYAQPGVAKVTWLNDPYASMHCKDKATGYGKAVDLVPYPVDWNDTARFNRLALLMFRAAALENVKIRWGADWDGDGRYREKGEFDSPHFELVL